MNWIDGVAIAVVVYCGFKGASRGAVWQLAAIVTLILAAVFTARLAPRVETALPESIEPQLRSWVAIGVVYLGLSFAVYLLAGRLRAMFEKARFVEFDRHWGAIIGAAKGAMMVLVAVSLVAITLPNARPEIRQSRTGLAAKFALERVVPLMPEWASEASRSVLDESDNGSDREAIRSD